MSSVLLAIANPTERRKERNQNNSQKNKKDEKKQKLLLLFPWKCSNIIFGQSRKAFYAEVSELADEQD